MKDISAGVLGKDMNIAVIAGRFNRFIVDQLVAGARDALATAGDRGVEPGSCVGARRLRVTGAGRAAGCVR